MNKIKVILSYLFGFIVSVSLFVLALLLIVKFSVFDKSFVYRVIDENNYYENVYKSISENIEDYMVSSGLDSSVLDGVVTFDDVKSDVKNYVDNMYNGKVYSADTSKMKDVLENNIKSFLSKQNLQVDSTSELDLFASDVVSIYSKEVSLYNMFDGYIPKIVKVNNLLNKCIVIDTIVLGISAVILLCLRFVSIGSSIMSSGLILLLVKWFVFERIDTNNVLIVSSNFSSVLRSIFRYISIYMLEVSVILIIIGFMFSLIKNKRK